HPAKRIQGRRLYGPRFIHCSRSSFMSAMLAVTQHDRIEVMADAAFYDVDGTLTAIAPKIHPVPRANAVFVSRGLGMAFPLFMTTCAEFDYNGFDEFVSTAAEDVFRVMDGVFADLAPDGGY